MTYKEKISSFVHMIRKIFLSGLLTILPIAITYSLLSFFFCMLGRWLNPIYQLEPVLLKKIPGAEIGITLLFIFLVGAILKYFLLHLIIHYLENILNKIPLLRQVYFGVKQIVHAFTAHEEPMFQQVVLVEFPRKGLYTIGFLTATIPTEVSPSPSTKYFGVYIPTTPNPATGNFIYVTHDDFIEISLTRQEAMAIIISGGIIQPERYTKKPKIE